MGSYLESYGAIEERKARNKQILKRALIAFVCIMIVALFLYTIFKNYGPEQRVKALLADLRNHRYQTAYGMFGCTAEHPCRDYAYSKFLEDWGPNSPHANDTNARIGLSQTCGNGVLLRVDYPHAQPMLLMVDRATRVISFAPSDWSECPGRHWHFGTFLRSIFRG